MSYAFVQKYLIENMFKRMSITDARIEKFEWGLKTFMVDQIIVVLQDIYSTFDNFET